MKDLPEYHHYDGTEFKELPAMKYFEHLPLELEINKKLDWKMSRHDEKFLIIKTRTNEIPGCNNESFSATYIDT